MVGLSWKPHSDDLFPQILDDSFEVPPILTLEGSLKWWLNYKETNILKAKQDCVIINYSNCIFVLIPLEFL